MKIIIVGNGVAGISAAEAIRNKNKEVEIVMYSDEKYYHYSRPRVIEYLSGKINAEKIIIKNKEFYETNDIKLNLNIKVEKIDTDNKKVILSDGKEDNYDKLIIATGAGSFLPPVKGNELTGVFTLRTLNDADKIINFVKDKKSVVIIGGGLLGLESAMSLKNTVNEVFVVEFFERLLPRQLDKEAADFFQNIIEKKGLKILLNKQTSEITKENDKLKIIFKDGETLYTDMVLFSAGIKSNIDIIKSTKIEFNKGIKINSNMETSVKDIYAAGDVTEFNGAIYGIWPAAKEQGIIAGLNSIGENIKYNGSVISTKLKVTGIELASIGNIDKKEDVDVYTKKGDNFFKRLFIKDKIIIGAILLGDTTDYQKIQENIKNKVKVEEPSNII